MTKVVAGEKKKARQREVDEPFTYPTRCVRGGNAEETETPAT